MSAGDMAALEQTSLARLDLDARPAEHPHEARLIVRLKADDMAAFEELVAHFELPVYCLCYRLLGDAEEARDAAQETFMKVYRGLKHFRGDSGLKTWIYRIAINQTMNQQRWWRRRHKDETVSLELSRADSEITLGSSLPSSDATPEQQAMSSEREERVMRALGEIKKEYRAALVLREVEELSYEEIAEALAISIGTVKSRIARGREDLRRRVRNLI
ncbi:MAG TPA: sigma-70 family RNA polymerase sigma factor [Blastocatellia bacterium]|nr:sigma-70 family RNA polymerase sigma factor [Blastocatellia bacterium]